MNSCKNCFRKFYYSWWWFAYCCFQILVCMGLMVLVACDMKHNPMLPLVLITEIVVTSLIIFDIIMIVWVKGRKVCKSPVFLFEIIIALIFITVFLYMINNGFSKSYDELDYALAGARYAVQVLRLALYIYNSYKLVKHRKSVKTLTLEDVSDNHESKNPNIKIIRDSFFEEIANKNKANLTTSTTIKRPTKESGLNAYERNFHSINA